MQYNHTNYHSHCNFCDGRGAMEDFVKVAISCGMTAYGITSHTTFPMPPVKSLQPDTYGKYFEEFARLRALYGDKIELYVGLEIDYLDEVRNPRLPFYATLPTDYTIGGVHFVANDCGEWMCTDGAFERFREAAQERFGGDIRRIVELFYEKSSLLVKCGHFDIHAHPDKIALNASQFEPAILQESWYENLAYNHICSLRGGDFLVEVNTKALEQHNRIFPGVEWLPLVRRLGLKLVVNSDCHDVDKIESGRYETLQILRNAGITHVWELHNGRWSEEEIRL